MTCGCAYSTDRPANQYRISTTCGLHHWRERAAQYYGARYALIESGGDPNLARSFERFKDSYKYIEDNFPPGENDMPTLKEKVTKKDKDDGIVARLEMTVEFTEYPDHADVERIVDEANGYGAVVKATLSALKPVTTEFS